MKDANLLFALVQSFFSDYLKKVRGATEHTVAAYRDALKLFIQFAAQHRNISVERLGLDDLHVGLVAAFLQYLERDRKNRISTRNCRRIALRAFFQHALREDPSRAGQYSRVLALPAKRTSLPAPRYLEPHQMRLLLEQPDRRSARGQRDHALLLFLYNTGARISEAIAVRRRDIQFVPPYHVRLFGKGRKERYCPLWPDTANALKSILSQEPPDSNDPVFRSIRLTPLSRHGAKYILTKYVRKAITKDQTFHARVNPHMLRHSCACALLQAGVDLTVIRDYLGHASIVTTSRYANSNLKLKRDALSAFWAHAGLTASNAAPWRPSKTVLSYLSSL